MQDQFDALNRSRQRWRAIALALALGHLAVAVGGYFVLTRLQAQVNTAQALAQQERAKAEAIADMVVAIEREHAKAGQGALSQLQHYVGQTNLEEQLERLQRYRNPAAERSDHPLRD
jgi:hypothetical protein